MSSVLFNSLLIFAMTAAFFSGGVMLKQYSLSDDVVHIIIAFCTYGIGNCFFLMLIAETGLARAMTFSSAAQVALTSLVAVLWFGEKLSLGQGIAILIAVAACTYLTMPGDGV